ncbi:uncharacterized protein LOC127831699 [Dreissena polymorpha]|uniref:ZZ-type domain-containing protein n=1 Tax=Dreissena polymorpha TaxID=45954 RepID=A0A9D4GZI4_DREPO|nr:uncharacterized protein LOC127831699 [Dreissena polymorpha]KAH3824264.1 hypothetical protein DPMN_126097 [Dreissena polymorpha]
MLQQVCKVIEDIFNDSSDTSSSSDSSESSDSSNSSAGVDFSCDREHKKMKRIYLQKLSQKPIKSVLKRGIRSVRDFINPPAKSAKCHAAGVKCDICNQDPIRGDRRTCKQCKDYHICFRCYKGAKKYTKLKFKKIKAKAHK